MILLIGLNTAGPIAHRQQAGEKNSHLHLDVEPGTKMSLLIAMDSSATTKPTALMELHLPMSITLAHLA